MSRSSLRASVAICLFSLLGMPAAASAAEPSLDDVEYHPDRLPPEGIRQRLILTGAGVAAAWYGVSFGSSYLWSDSRAASDWKIPVAGPWMALGKTGCREAEGSACTDTWVVIRTGLTLVASVGQVGGLAAIVEGLFTKTAPGGPPPPAVPAENEKQATSAQWIAAPMTDASSLGLQVIGTF